MAARAAYRRRPTCRTLRAAVLLKPSRGMQGTVFVQGASRESTTDTLPKIVLAGEHYNLIARLLQQNVPVKLRVNVQSRFLDDRRSYNVLAEIPGTDPVLKDQVVMLGAHLDSWHAGTGATDNADGAVAAWRRSGSSRRSARRPAGHCGSPSGAAKRKDSSDRSAYVRDHLEGDAHKAERDRVDVYFNIDPGKGPIYGWYLREQRRGAADLRRVARAVQGHGRACAT